MRVILTVITLFTLSVSNAFSLSYHIPPELKKKYSVTYDMERSKIVVVGKVSKLDYKRRSLHDEPRKRGGWTTDVTIEIDELIKGKPNAGKNQVIFMVEGGMNLRVTGQPEFEIGEEVVIFLKDNPEPGSYYRNYPHGRISLVEYYMGKRKIEDGKVYFLYPRAEDSLIAVWFPIELAIVYSRAVVKDKEVMKPFEDEIRMLARKEKNKVDLPETLVKRMMTESKKVLNSTPLSPSQ